MERRAADEARAAHTIWVFVGAIFMTVALLGAAVVSALNMHG